MQFCKTDKISSNRFFLNNQGLTIALHYCVVDEESQQIWDSNFFKADANPKSGSVVPIAFPLIAGSGTLTTIMSLKANYDDVNIFFGILINCIVIFLVLKSVKWIEKALGPNGMTVIRKFFGVILLAIAVKIFGSNFLHLGK